MPLRHTLLALLVAVLWGLNFLAIRISLDQFPPLFLAGLRFLILALPALLFVPWPGVKVRYLLGYGLGFGTLQFFGLYLGMSAGFPTGLASLVLQASAPFTVLLGALVLKEHITGRRALGVGVAVVGLGLVGLSRGVLDGWTPFLLVLFGAFGWALGNLASRKAQTDRPMALVLWMAVVPPIPLLTVAFLVEGPEQIGAALGSSFSLAAIPAWLGLSYTILFGTVAGAGIWVWLMRRHPAGTVAPFSMLVPVVGILAAWAALGEVPTWLELGGGVLVVSGVIYASVRGTPPAQPAPEPELETEAEPGARDVQSSAIAPSPSR
ncbi:EamA family transporter [Nesterenkonia sandarakina]|uniref:O-acetylserine/cysteine efflux transporter n=1 Tax=Nesterenkonia sandarakina TaxID=272918 RepID=A0A7Z0J3X5_9MICC|nr:EamA family transporter [Nesterenkonia sandarakina]NYJ17421.1 O-acetylserine/cysteine efflux transporter [Nesterenkonia sandarakina]